MKIVLLFNPRSGGSSRRAELDRLADGLRADAHHVELVRAGPGDADSPPGATLRDALHGADALVIAGGDGTLHHALADASRAAVPVYHLPLGTENLFARERGMKHSLTALRRAIADARSVPVDLGDCDGRLFSLMCSVGPDAGVVARVARARTGSITRWAYLRAALAELRAVPPTLRIWVDGDLVVDARRGLALVANARAYGAHIDPASRASMDDALLDLVFFPADSAWGVLLWLLRARLRRHTQSPALIYRTGREIVIANAGPTPAPVQCDGEATGQLTPGDAPTSAIQIVVRQAGLRVLGDA